MHDAEQFRCHPSVEPGPGDGADVNPDVASLVSVEVTATEVAGSGVSANRADAAFPGALTDPAALLGRLDSGLAFLAGDGLIRWCNRSFEGHHPGGPWTGRHVLDLHDADDPVYEDPAALRLESEPRAEYRFEREVAGRVLHYFLRRAETAGGMFVLETSAVTSTKAGVRAGPFPEALLGPDGTILAINVAFAELLGERVASLIGRSLSEGVDVADRARLLGSLSETVGTGDGGTTVDAIEVRLVRADGEPGWAELVLLAGSAPSDTGSAPSNTAHGSHAMPVTVLVQARDITARKRDALLLQEVFESAPLPYALVDTDGVVVGVNPAWRQRLGPNHGPGQPLSGAVAEESRQQLASLFAASGSSTTPDSRELPEDGFELVTLLELAEGGPALARLRATALHDLDGQVERFLVSLDDLTAHALEVEAARRASGQIRATLDELDLAVVSHDAEGRAQELNLGAVRLFGDSAAGLIGSGPLPPGWRALGLDQAVLADERHPVSLVLAAGGPLTAGAVVWLSPDPGTGEVTDRAAPGPRYLIRARAVTQLRPARRVGAVVAYAELA